MYQSVATVTCDKCGKVVSVDPKSDDPFLSPFTQEENGLDGWMRLNADVHLCPSCAAVLRTKISDYEDELRRVIGVPDVSVAITAKRA
jgi:NAD-dependent SIR2 family protein deacetylase